MIEHGVFVQIGFGMSIALAVLAIPLAGLVPVVFAAANRVRENMHTQGVDIAGQDPDWKAMMVLSMAAMPFRGVFVFGRVRRDDCGRTLGTPDRILAVLLVLASLLLSLSFVFVTVQGGLPGSAGPGGGGIVLGLLLLAIVAPVRCLGALLIGPSPIALFQSSDVPAPTGRR